MPEKPSTDHMPEDVAKRPPRELSLEDARRRVADLGLRTPAEAATIVREDRDSGHRESC